MSFDLSTFRTDQKKETEGVWHDIGGGSRLLIARLGNKRYNEEFRKIPAGVRQQIQRGIMDDEQTDNIVCELLADTVLLGWEEMLLDGEPIEYSRENAFRMLKEIPDFRAFVWDLADEAKNYRDEQLGTDIKNSKTSSDGNSATED